MKTLLLTHLALVLVLAGGNALAQADASSDADDLKIAALEALVAAPPERALPIVSRILQGDAENSLKQRALFVLSQIEHPEAYTILLDSAREDAPGLREEAIRMIGISGHGDTLDSLATLYPDGDDTIRAAIIEAYMIADDSEALYELAVNAGSVDEFNTAVETLGAMGAMQELRALRENAGMSAGLIEAYAIAGDVDSLRELAADSSQPEMQVQAIRGLAVAGEDAVGPELMAIYRSTDSAAVRDAAREGLLIADYDDGVLELFRQVDDAGEKRELLELLVIMESDAVWDVIDSTLDNER